MANRIILFNACMLSVLVAFAQQNESGIVKLRGTRLTYPLVNKWIVEFKKEYPTIEVSITPAAPVDSIDFIIASHALRPSDLEGNRKGVAVSRYVQLPVANSQRPGLAEFQRKGVTEKNLGDLFFTSSTPNIIASSQSNTPIALYVRDRPVCAVIAFADHFGENPKKLKGIGIKGDDQDLAEAVRKDVYGLSFNNLGFIYDVRTRKITDGIAVIPQDLNENGKIDKEEQVYTTLDQLIDFIEKTHNPKFVNERVNFIFNENTGNTSAGIFLNWVLTEGQKFSHGLGFLYLDDNLLAEQKAIAASTFKVSSVSSCESGEELMRKRKSKLVND